MSRNEAAERLRKRLIHEPVSHHAIDLLDEALATERRLTVERVAAVFRQHPIHWDVKRGTGTGTRFVMTRMFETPEEAAEWFVTEYVAADALATADVDEEATRG